VHRTRLATTDQALALSSNCATGTRRPFRKFFSAFARRHTYDLASTSVSPLAPLDRIALISRQARAPISLPVLQSSTCCQMYLTKPWHFRALRLYGICTDTMRLLKYNSTAGLSLTENRVDEEQIPPYAILSHTWQHGKEVIFDDFKEGTIGKPGQNKVGYDKILFCARQAQRDGLHHVWVDTCCINKNDGVELQHAINSMFRWYKAAAQCYVYLWDVSTSDERSGLDWEIDLRQSLWFTRGWVIQPQVRSVCCLSVSCPTRAPCESCRIVTRCSCF
jgi:hypothetical protein